MVKHLCGFDFIAVQVVSGLYFELSRTIMGSLFRVFGEYGRKEHAEEAVRFMAANGIKVGLGLSVCPGSALCIAGSLTIKIH